MALFNYQADGDKVAFLTRFYQVELPGEWEGFLHGLNFDEADAAGIASRTSAETMERYAGYQASVRAFMDSLADGSKLPMEIIGEIMKILEEGSVKTFPTLVPGLDGMTTTETAPGIRVGFSKIKSARDFILAPKVEHPRPHMAEGGLVSYVAWAIERLYTRSVGLGSPPARALTENIVARCTECKNPFVRLSNKRQIFCSKRCRHRRGQRDRMRRLFAKPGDNPVK